MPDWDDPMVQRLATAALLVYSGNNYGDYLDMVENEEITFEDDEEPLTPEEFVEAAPYGEWVHEAVARLIGNHMSGYYPS